MCVGGFGVLQHSGWGLADFWESSGRSARSFRESVQLILNTSSGSERLLQKLITFLVHFFGEKEAPLLIFVNRNMFQTALISWDCSIL